MHFGERVIKLVPYHTLNATYFDSRPIHLHCLEHEVHTYSVSMTLNVDPMFEPLHSTGFPHPSITD